jgi:xanthine dehydrogenase accessory factor
MKLIDSDWPTFGWVTDLRHVLIEARGAVETIVLGTLIRIEGSSPRPVGSQMVFRAASAFGYFSGGCLESDVANHAQAVLENGEPRRLIYGRGSPWIDIRLACGGTLEILLERINHDDTAVGALQKFTENREPSWWVSDGWSRQVTADACMRLMPNQYAQCYAPTWRIIVIGGDPIALALASLSVSAGFETIIIRPDGPFTPPPLTNVRYMRENVGTAIEELMPDRWTAVVTATHDDGVDDAAIIAAMHASAAYVGVLGSAGRIAPRRERLLAVGLQASKIASLHAPIGAVRCGKAPWEIAVSVVAEIMQTRTDGTVNIMDDTGRRLMAAAGLNV